MGIKSLLIGVNEYIDASNLKYCVNDALALNSILNDRDLLNLSEIVTILLCDDQEAEYRPIGNNIRENLDLLVENVDVDDSIIFFFAGHGDELEGEPVILPSDFRRGLGLKSAISIEDIKNTLMKSKAKYKLLIFDSCHSGAIPGREESGTMRQATYNAFDSPPEGFTILSSCSINQLSYEDDESEHGVFTYYLLEGMKGKADSNLDGKITINELYDYLYPLVKQRVFNIHKRNQTPHRRENMQGIFTIANLLKKETDEKIEVKNFSKHSFNKISLIFPSFLDVDEHYNLFGFEDEQEVTELRNEILLSLRSEYGITNLIDDGKTVTFPDGSYETSFYKEPWEATGILNMDIQFSYQESNSERIENVIKGLHYEDMIKSISLVTKRIVDITCIEKLCDEKGFRISKVELKPPMLEFIYPDFSHPRILVTSYPEVTIIRISKLGDSFFDYINTEFVADLLGECFK